MTDKNLLAALVSVQLALAEQLPGPIDRRRLVETALQCGARLPVARAHIERLLATPLEQLLAELSPAAPWR